MLRQLITKTKLNIWVNVGLCGRRFVLRAELFAFLRDAYSDAYSDR